MDQTIEEATIADNLLEGGPFLFFLNLFFSSLGDASFVKLIQKNCKEKLKQNVFAADEHRIKE